MTSESSSMKQAAIPKVVIQEGKLVQRSYRTPVGVVVDFGIQIGDIVYEPRASAVSPIGVSEAKKGWREVPAQEKENYRYWEKKSGKFGNRARAIADIEKRWDEIITKGKTSQEHAKEQLASYESYMERRAKAERQYSLKSSDLIIGMSLEEIATGNKYVITEITDEGWVYARPENEPTQSGGSIGKGEVKGYQLAVQIVPEVAIPISEVAKGTEKFVLVKIIKDTEKTTQYAGGKVKFGYNEYVVWPDGEKTLLSKEKAASGTLYRTEGRYADPQTPDISATSRDLLRDKVSRRYSELVVEPILVEEVGEEPEAQSYPRRIGGIKPRHYPSVGGLLE